MKVILRLNKGITTKAINIPESCVRGDYRLPYTKEMTAALIGTVQEAGARFSSPYLVFKWDRKSVWGNGNAKEPIPIMDLVDVSY